MAALIHTASHISLISSALVQELGVKQDVLPDTSIPPSPLAACKLVVAAAMLLMFGVTSHVTVKHVHLVGRVGLVWLVESAVPSSLQ